MPEDDDEIVFVANNRGGYSKVYHTDPDCQLLDQANGVRERPLSIIHTRRECKYCAGEKDTGGAGDGHFKSLLDAAAEEGGAI